MLVSFRFIFIFLLFAGRIIHFFQDYKSIWNKKENITIFSGLLKRQQPHTHTHSLTQPHTFIDSEMSKEPQKEMDPQQTSTGGLYS